MKRVKIVLLVTMSVLMTVAMAQDSEQRIREVKYKFITEKVGLGADQKDEFWKIYEEAGTKRRDLRVRMSQNRMGLRMSSIGEKEAEKIIDKELDLKQEVLDLEKEYLDRYKKVISIQQIIALLKAEDDFNKMMMQRLRQRDGNNTPGRRGNEMK